MGAEVGSHCRPVGVVVGAAVGIGIALATSSSVENFFGSVFQRLAPAREGGRAGADRT